MRFVSLLLAFCLGMSGTVVAVADSNRANEPVEEIVITLDDLDRYTAALLRIYALSNEITLRVATKKEDLRELHGEFNSRVMKVLDDWDLTVDRYNEIERSSQLIPSIYKEIKKRVLSSDERLQELAQTPKTLNDAKRLLRGRVDYPITAKTMPWFADDEELKGMAEEHMGGSGAKQGPGQLPGMPSGMNIPGL